MDVKLLDIIEKNNKIIKELSNSIQPNMNLAIYNAANITNEDELKSILTKQLNDISKLYISLEMERQNSAHVMRERIKKLREIEPDKDFSNFYHNGIIVIDNIEVKIDDFYIKEFIDNNNSLFYSLFCTDKRIDNHSFGIIDETDLKLRNIYHLKNSQILYEMYKNKYLYNDNRIVLDEQEKFELFIRYMNNDLIKKKHKLVAETMIQAEDYVE